MFSYPTWVGHILDGTCDKFPLKSSDFCWESLFHMAWQPAEMKYDSNFTQVYILHEIQIHQPVFWFLLHV